jgi:hypothetical protein
VSLRYAAERAYQAIEKHKQGCPADIEYARYLLGLSLDCEPGAPGEAPPVPTKPTDPELAELASYREDYPAALERIRELDQQTLLLKRRLAETIEARGRETYDPQAVSHLLALLDEEACPCEDCKRRLKEAVAEVVNSERKP